MNQLILAEKILLEKFKTEPFHNFKRLKEASLYANCTGGTCSDKTLSYLEELKGKGIDGYLHSAVIAGKFKHQLVRIEYNETSYFADVGNGWPSIHLFPSDEEVKYSCYGMQFRTELQDDLIKVFHRRNGRETIQMEINKNPQSQQLIKKNINNRFSDNIQYPFETGLRFSLIVGDNFLFIRDSNLEIYSNLGIERLKEVEVGNLSYFLREYFSFDIKNNCI